MKRLVGILIAGALAGCAVGPEQVTLDTSVVDDFVRDADHGPVDATWWTSFGDPLLTSLVERALEANLSLDVAAARVHEARAARRAARAGFAPRVDARVSAQRQRGSENGQVALGELADLGFADTTTDLYDAGVDASWELDVFGRIARGVEGADERMLASVEARRAIGVAVAAEVARTYVDLRGAERRLHVAEGQVTIQASTAERIAARRDVGLARDLDVERAVGQLRASEAAVPPLRADADAARFALAVLLARQPGSLDDELARGAPLVVRGDAVPVGLPSDLLARRADVRAAERRARAALADVGRATADLYPRVELTGGFGSQATSFPDLFESASRQWSIGPRVSWPLFRGGELRARVDASEARLDGAVAEFRQAVLAAIAEVETALARYAEEELRRRALVASVGANRRAVDLARSLYDEGLTDALDVLDAERRLRETEDALVVSETRVTTGLVALYEALGGGWEALAEA